MNIFPFVVSNRTNTKRVQRDLSVGFHRLTEKRGKKETEILFHLLKCS